MYQKWRNLLFLHWEIDPAVIQDSLPGGLTVDTYQGKAYLGVVPFFMKDIRPRFLPAIPSVSNFLEANVRTYVYDQYGRPGVWFYSLDANQWLAVRVAKSFFHLPYHDAAMSATGSERTIYKVHRKGTDARFQSEFRYSELDRIEAQDPSSLEFFLIERYLLFAADRESGRVFSGRVHHEPYPLSRVEAQVVSEGLAALAGFPCSGKAPDHAIMSRGVDVEVFALEAL